MSASRSSEAETVHLALEAQRIEVSVADAALVLRDWDILENFHSAMREREPDGGS